MKQDIRFYVALNLENHPICNEKDIYKKNYINALYYFVSKYSGDDIYAKKLLDRYNDSLYNNYKIDMVDQIEFKKSVNKSCGFKIKGFRLFTYRFVFICDCLFINAYDNPELAKKILDEFKNLFSSRYHLKIDDLFEVLYNDKDLSTDFKLAEGQIRNWIENKKFIKKSLKTVAVTATMSAGKSTLINAIVGKDVLKAQNDSCTSKCFGIYGKAFEDNSISCISDSLSLNAKHMDLMNLNNTEVKDVSIVTFMQSYSDNLYRLHLIDTPGVNSSMDLDHLSITREILNKQEYDKLLYLINAENIGSEDDLKHMRYISDHLPHNKILFVLNKLDRFRKQDDSISESLKKIIKQLISIGFKDPKVVPISAFAGQLFKRVLCGVSLNEDEEDECVMLLKKFSKSEFDLSVFYDEPVSWEGQLSNGINKFTSLQVAECLKNTGLLSLERLISMEDM